MRQRQHNEMTKRICAEHKMETRWPKTGLDRNIPCNWEIQEAASSGSAYVIAMNEALISTSISISQSLAQIDPTPTSQIPFSASPIRPRSRPRSSPLPRSLDSTLQAVSSLLPVHPVPSRSGTSRHAPPFVPSMGTSNPSRASSALSCHSASSREF